MVTRRRRPRKNDAPVRISTVFLSVAVLAGCSTGAPHDAPPAAVTVTVAASPSSTTAAPTDETITSEAPASGKCTLHDVHPQVTLKTGEAGQRHTTVTWTNESARTCTMDGYPGLDLDGRPPSPYSLPRQLSVSPSTVTLAPGEQAHTVITWLPGDWTPATILITPPDDVQSARLDWPGGGVLRQDGATHPGTYVGPVEPGANA